MHQAPWQNLEMRAVNPCGNAIAPAPANFAAPGAAALQRPASASPPCGSWQFNDADYPADLPDGRMRFAIQKADLLDPALVRGREFDTLPSGQ